MPHASYVSKITQYAIEVAWEAAKHAHEVSSAFVDDRAGGGAGENDKMGWQPPKIALMWHGFGYSYDPDNIPPHRAP